MSEGEKLLALHLRAAKIPFEREVTFSDERDFRFDFLIWGPALMLAVEVDGGSYTGGHRRGGKTDSHGHTPFENECVKTNLAILAGYRVLHFSPAMVESGEALQVIEKAIKAFI